MKRHLLIIAICLLLGAVLNVAVAWGAATWSGPSSIDPDEARFVAERVWNRYAPEGSPPFHEYHVVTRWGMTGAVVSSGVNFSVLEVRVGSPIRSFQYHMYLHEGNEVVNGWVVPSKFVPVSRWWQRTLILPYEPIWPGLVINTLFYAAILWLLIPGPFALRRFLRVRRGLCTACAYPMGESSVCTECGVTLRKRGRPT